MFKTNIRTDPVIDRKSSSSLTYAYAQMDRSQWNGNFGRLAERLFHGYYDHRNLLDRVGDIRVRSFCLLAPTVGVISNAIVLR